MDDSSSPTIPTPVGVFVLDDHAFVHLGLAGLLNATSDITIVGEASTAAEAMHRLPDAKPDLALLDIGLPDGNGIDVGREIRSRYPATTCLMLTSHDDEEAHLAAVLAGAAGYLIKQIQGPTIVESIRRAARGESLLDPVATGALLDRLRGIVRPTPARATWTPPPRTERPGSRLSDREQLILDLAVAGRTNREIAAELDIADDTISRQVSVIFTKLSLERRVQAAVRAHRSHVAAYRPEEGRFDAASS
ncbi:response regulator [uncultured Friedmanniella sp.]|uniref:response regulator n=1 Tax=uncultured Friedmanniella sp. TaxID=335381 RepID=UPI0035CC82CA